MVQTCIVCCVNSNNNKDVSFHQFPKDIAKRTLWLERLNLTSVSSWHKVCSKHFSAKDFRFSNNRNILQSTAVPGSDYKPVQEEHNYAQTVLTSTPINTRSSDAAKTSEVHGSSPITWTKNYEKVNMVEISQSFPFKPCTNTDSQPEKKRRIWSSSRIGDLREEDFSTPSKRKSNFCLVQNTVKKLRRKNKILNQRNLRLKRKVSSLLDIIKDLNKV